MSLTDLTRGDSWFCRNNAKNFASTVSLSSTAKHKVIIIDRGDNTTPDVQLIRALLRNLLVTAGSSSPVTTRKSSLPSTFPLCVIDFSIRGRKDRTERKKLGSSKELQEILDQGNIGYDPKVLAASSPERTPNTPSYLPAVDTVSI